MTHTTIHKYQSKDEPAIQAITYKTGFKGEGLEGRNFITDQRLWFMLFIYYYVRYEPEHCFVATAGEVGDPVIGYICGTPDTRTQSQRFKLKVLPRVVGRAFLYTSWRYPRTLLSLIRMAPMMAALDPDAESRIAEQYPAHLHINLLPGYQRLGIGSMLITTFEDHLRTLGIPGLHLETSNYHRKAVPFYLKHGYQIVWDAGPVCHPFIKDLHFLTFAKSLQ